MRQLFDYIKKIIVCVLMSMITATIITFVMTRDIEVIAGSLLFGLFILPSIFIYYILDFFHKSHKLKTIGYVLPIVGWAIYLAVGIMFDAQRPLSEGAGEMATLVLVSDVSAGIVVYILISNIKWLSK